LVDFLKTHFLSRWKKTVQESKDFKFQIQFTLW
jgi:hypothetical protein